MRRLRRSPLTLARINWGRGLGAVAFLVLSWLYCQPGHPSAGQTVRLDVLLHVGLFVVLGAWWGHFVGRGAMATTTLVGIGVGLELAQMARGGYATPEYLDVACNLLGALLGLSLGPLIRRFR